MSTTNKKGTENPIKASVSLLQAATHCHHAHQAVEEIRALVKESLKNTVARRKIDSQLQILSRVLPLISSIVKERATLCAPTKSNVRYAQARVETALRAASKAKPKLSPSEKLSAFLKESGDAPRRNPRRTKVPTVSPEKKKDSILPNLPTPSNGKKFTLEEAVQAFNKYPDRKLVSKVVDQWESNNWLEKNYSMQHWYRLAKQVKNGKHLSELRKPGRKPFMEVVQLKDDVEKTKNGATIGLKEIGGMIEQNEKKRAIEAGIFYNPEAKRPCTRTLENYKSLVPLISDTYITNSAVAKTEVREVAERSIRSCVSFLMTVAVTHFQIGKIQTGRSPVSDATEGAQKFERLVSQANDNVHVRPIQPQFLTSTDDNGQYHVVGINENDECEWRVGKNDGENTGVRAKYKRNKKSMLIGQRARISWTAAADGSLAQPYLSFLGLTERELPFHSCPNGVLILPIQGLAVGGVNGCQNVGFVAFVRQDENVERENFEYYQENVYRPFIESKRNLQPGAPLEEEMRAVSWQDGGGAQLRAITKPEAVEKDDELKITKNKHSASRSAVEQFLDLMKIFKIMKRQSQIITAASRPLIGFKRKVYDQMKDLQKTGATAFSAEKFNCICDFIVTLPEMLTTSVTSTRILEGFIQGGAIDSKTVEWPDMHSILATCRRDISKEELSIIENNFQKLYDAQVQFGKIPETVFDELHLGEDTTHDGTIRPRRYEAECHQRAMCLSADSVRKAREDKLRQAREKKDYELKVERNKILSHLSENKSVEEQLPDDKALVTHEMLEKFSKNGLKAFVHCRLFQSAARPRNAEWNGTKYYEVNKGNAERANRGEDNLVSRAMKLIHNPVILEAPSIPDVESNSVENAGPTVLRTLTTSESVFEQTPVKDLQENQNWIDQVKNEVKGVVYISTPRRSQQDILVQSESLVKHLFLRMGYHLESRFADTKFWSHWSFRWARKQFTRVALMSCMANHVKLDLEAMKVSDSLLSTRTSAFQTVERNSECSLEGGYIVYDAPNGKFVRSGKASPVSIVKRLEGHIRAAQTTEKGFYGRYPHRSNPNIRRNIRQGYFDQLIFFYALAFDRKNGEHLVDTSENGIFEWDDVTLSAIKEWRISGTEMEKRFILVAYLFELVYDLLVAPGDNVSLNAGFEQCHGQVSLD